MKIPAWLRERIHEWVTPGGCWISNKLAKSFCDAGMMKEGRIGLSGAAALALASHAAKRNADVLTVTIEAQVSAGVPIGDWRITVERINAQGGRDE